nr:hypothetical protein [Lentzea guizhouensis]
MTLSSNGSNAGGVAVDVERSGVLGVVVLRGGEHDGHGQVGADAVLVRGGFELRPGVLVLADDRADGLQGAGGFQAGTAVGAVLLLVDLDERGVAGGGGARLLGSDGDGDGVGVLDRSRRRFGEPLQDLVEGLLGGEPVAQHRQRGGRLVQALHRVLPVDVRGPRGVLAGQGGQVVHAASPSAGNEFTALDAQRSQRMIRRTGSGGRATPGVNRTGAGAGSVQQPAPVPAGHARWPTARNARVHGKALVPRHS